MYLTRKYMCYKKPPFHKCLIILVILLFAYPTNTYSQSYNKISYFKSYWHLNFNGGTSLFFGDIKQYQFAPVSNYENEWRFGGGVMLGKQISPVFGVRGQFLYGKLAGTRRPSNLYFEADYLEFNLNSTIGLRNIFQKYKHGQFWNAYLLLGIGLTNHNTELMELNTKKVIKRVGHGSGKSFGGRTLEGMLMGGIGLDLRLSNRININLESANRILNSDDLDGKVSGFKYDVYNYTSFGISYKFGGNTGKSRKAKTYTINKPKGEDGDVKTFDYDYEQPIAPPEVDVLTIEPVIVSKPVIPEEKEILADETPVVVVTEEPVSYKPVYVTGTEYRVQIRAKYGNPISINHLSNNYNIPSGEIHENTHNGFYIYTVGSFTSYEEAREKRNYLRSSKGISDCFVVAFRNGKRLNKLP